MPLLSPPEYSYLRTSLLSEPPIRPDLRSLTAFRPLAAELTLLPTTHGSSRLFLPDGSECIVGIKPELSAHPSFEVSIEIAGLRDDDPMAVLLAGMVADTIRAQVHERLRTSGNWSSGAAEGMETAGGAQTRGRPWGWKLYIDVVVVSPPASHPGGLVSLAVHLALRDLRLPKLVSAPEEDPVFDDDYEACEWLFPREAGAGGIPAVREGGKGMNKADTPAVTVLVAAVGDNVLFDPTREEMVVADCVAAVSVTRDGSVGGLRMLETGSGGENGGVGRKVVNRIVKEVGVAAGGLFESLDQIVRTSI
ncbi:hypothetical protein EX30DRAFT_140532 [Ascodesmis nigricans]|uniref:Ribosomal RNA-processing protein 42 n=1 Tax=Ascodesmis nigricans TaxID=341454 RepID=A0A4S2N0X8_9PEZI|nr:hypothetical protein EX30DRAFT_140532 [Ascodesmis nigricans]